MAKLSEINENLTCILCNGYFIDATTISECLHSFCKSCIVKYLETNKCCPICETPVGTKPLLAIRSDPVLQDIVYKLIPHVFKNEMDRRRQFYSKQTETAPAPASAEDRGEVPEHRMFYMPNDKISLSLEYGYGKNQIPDLGYNTSGQTTDSTDNSAADQQPEEFNESETMKRYLLCPAGLSILHLKKFIARKYALPTTYKVDVMYLQEILCEDYTLMDVAYIYAWRRSDPMRLFYRIIERPLKRLKTSHPQTVEAKSGSGVSNANSDISTASNNSVGATQPNLVGPQASSCASHTSTSTTTIMTGAAQLPPSPALKTVFNSRNASNNSCATGVTSGKGSIATPKHALDASKSVSTVNCALTAASHPTQPTAPPTAVTPQGILKSKSMHTSASAVQTDEPPKKLRKILPANESNSATTPKPVPVLPNASLETNCANTTSSTSTTTSTVHSLRQCRINSDRNKLSSSLATNPSQVGLSASKTLSKVDTKDTNPTKCVSDAGFNATGAKRNTSRKSSAFDVRTLIGTKSPTLECNRHSVEAMTGSECNESINEKKTSIECRSGTQTAKQSKVNPNANTNSKESSRELNRNRVTSGQNSTASVQSMSTGMNPNRKGASNSPSVALSRPPSNRSAAPSDRPVTGVPASAVSIRSLADSRPSVPSKSTKSGANVLPKQSNAKTLKTSQKDLYSVKTSNTTRDGMASDKSRTETKISIKPISSSSAKSVPQTQANGPQRQSSPLSPTSIRIKLAALPPQTTSTITTNTTTSANKSSSKSSAANAKLTTPLSIAPAVSAHIQSNIKEQKQNQSIEKFGSKQLNAKNALSDFKSTAAEAGHQPNGLLCGNQSATKSAVSPSSGAAKPKGASINQIVNKITSGVTAKSAKSTSVNVTSTTPTLELNKSNTSAAQLNLSSIEVTPNEVNDNKVSTTTSESGVGSSIQKNQCQSESAIKAVSSASTNSGNLVIRISTKSHSVESLVSPKDKDRDRDKSAQQKGNKFEIKRDFSSNSHNTNGSNRALNVCSTQCDTKNNKTSNECVNRINEKNVRNDDKCVNSHKTNTNSTNDNVVEEDDDEDDDIDGRKLVVDVPNEDSCENEIGTTKVTHEVAEDREKRGRDAIKVSHEETSLRCVPSSALSVRSMRGSSDASNRLAINISSTTALSANCAVLASPPPTPTPSPKSESDQCFTSDSKCNSSQPNGPLDLSMSTKKDRSSQQKVPIPVSMRAIYDIPPPKPKHCVNPAVLDKHRGLFPTAPTPNKQYASFKIMSGQSQGTRQSTGSPVQTTSPNLESPKKNRSIGSPIISSNTTSGGNQSANSSRHRSVSSHSNHHNSSHHHSSHHNHKNYSVITPDPHRYTPKIVIRNMGSPPSLSTQFNFSNHH